MFTLVASVQLYSAFQIYHAVFSCGFMVSWSWNCQFLVSLFLFPARGTSIPSDPDSVISPTKIHINPMFSQEERSPPIEFQTADMSTTLTGHLEMLKRLYVSHIVWNHRLLSFPTYLQVNQCILGHIIYKGFQLSMHVITWITAGRLTYQGCFNACPFIHACIHGRIGRLYTCFLSTRAPVLKDEHALTFTPLSFFCFLFI